MVREVASDITWLTLAPREQSAAYVIDNWLRGVASFVKNAGLGFAIPYLDNGEAHDYEPDLIIRVSRGENEYLVLAKKGYDGRRR